MKPSSRSLTVQLTKNTPALTHKHTHSTTHSDTHVAHVTSAKGISHAIQECQTDTTNAVSLCGSLSPFDSPSVSVSPSASRCLSMSPPSAASSPACLNFRWLCLVFGRFLIQQSFSRSLFCFSYLNTCRRTICVCLTSRFTKADQRCFFFLFFFFRGLRY